MEDSWPFPVPDTRFDQKNEMFKRCAWDEAVQPQARRFYQEVVFKPGAGYRKIDYAFRNAAWNLEASFSLGNNRSNHGLYAWEGLPAKLMKCAETDGPVRLPPEEMTPLIKKAARFYGADLAGIARVHPHWIYSHEFSLVTREHYPIELPEGLSHAIVLAVAMDYEGMKTSPTAVAGAATGLGYSRMAFTANLLAAFIRFLGWRAVPAGNDTALSVPLALAAGLGESSRMGLLITEKFGPRVRLCKVFTDLPLVDDTYRPFGVTEFCRRCRKCAVHCPAQAIPAGETTTTGPNFSNHSGIRKWYVDAERCFSFWAKNRMDCTSCIRVCPFNKPPGLLHDIVRGTIRRFPVLNPFIARMDDLLGYGKKSAVESFWKS
jgi:reductive dehalogenase